MRGLLTKRIGQFRGGPHASDTIVDHPCFHSDGTVGIGYSQAIVDQLLRGQLARDLDMHAAS